MCGITGWINLASSRQSATEEEAEILRRMCDRMRHRGPDSAGFWFDEKVCLGMRRLSIIDLQTGDQPVFNEDKSIIAMMNGEIYNFRELRSDLEKKGHTFRTKTDTEVLPHLYEEYGEAMLKHLNGMFAFALWDSKKQKLLIARDRFGEKPLFYGIFKDKLIFASEPKVLFEHPCTSKELDLQALRFYLSFDYVPAPFSIYKGIRKLPAAHFLKVENSTVSIEQYWRLSFGEKIDISLEEAVEKLHELLADSVKMRLIADVPLGILLSGGVDSSTVAALAAEHSSGKVKTFSIGFREDSFDESKFSRLVAKHLGTEHHEEILSVEKVADLISDIGHWLDEPLSDGSLIPTYLLARFVKQHVTVALGGDGGDEIFAGYPMYFGHKLVKAYRMIPKFLRRNFIEPVVEALPVSTKNLSFDYKAKRFVRASEYDFAARHHLWFGSFSLLEQEKLLSADVLSSTNGDIYEHARELLSECDANDDIERAQFLDMKLYLAEDILTKVDRASMAVSLEVRAPFLDPRIAEFVAKLPPGYKLNGMQGKFLLKKTVEKLLPKEVLRRPKKGFGIPIAEWLKGRLNPFLHDMLNADRLRKQGIFNGDYVSKLIKNHEQGKVSHHKELWTLLIFQIWFDNFMQN
ncbi:MAG: asparagine synthase (glutamine-hydrolyzing) [Acidobacteria bacterium]|jgi:asparagine synthase (glutamine-hydrolysing)|nr:MAG: asparagine synthase (glutamine-hydrolyzing) [Acidobacteriota bacterium]GIU82365.1 MAG: asparagine synthetase B [Pyrinomonadaceae bacterium]